MGVCARRPRPPAFHAATCPPTFCSAPSHLPSSQCSPAGLCAARLHSPMALQWVPQRASRLSRRAGLTSRRSRPRPLLLLLLLPHVRAMPSSRSKRQPLLQQRQRQPTRRTGLLCRQQLLPPWQGQTRRQRRLRRRISAGGTTLLPTAAAAAATSTSRGVTRCPTAAGTRRSGGGGGQLLLQRRRRKMNQRTDHEWWLTLTAIQVRPLLRLPAKPALALCAAVQQRGRAPHPDASPAGCCQTCPYLAAANPAAAAAAAAAAADVESHFKQVKKVKHHLLPPSEHDDAAAVAEAAAAEAAASQAVEAEAVRQRALLRRLGSRAASAAGVVAPHLTSGLAARAGGLLVLGRVHPGAARVVGWAGMAAPLAGAAAARAGVDLGAVLPARVAAAGRELGQVGKAAVALAAGRLLLAGLQQHQRRQQQRLGRRIQQAVVGAAQAAEEAGQQAEAARAVVAAGGQGLAGPSRLRRQRSSVNGNAAAVAAASWQCRPWQCSAVLCSPMQFALTALSVLRLDTVSCPTLHPLTLAQHAHTRLLQWLRWLGLRSWGQRSTSASPRQPPNGPRCMGQKWRRCGACWRRTRWCCRQSALTARMPSCCALQRPAACSRCAR
jgi:hypothetical protein